MLNAIHKDFQAMQFEEQLEDFLSYCEIRLADLAKDPTYVPGEKKKKKSKPRTKKGKMVTVNKLQKLDAGTLALLRKAGIEL